MFTPDCYPAHFTFTDKSGPTTRQFLSLCVWLRWLWLRLWTETLLKESQIAVEVKGVLHTVFHTQKTHRWVLPFDSQWGFKRKRKKTAFQVLPLTLSNRVVPRHAVLRKCFRHSSAVVCQWQIYLDFRYFFIILYGLLYFVCCKLLKYYSYHFQCILTLQHCLQSSLKHLHCIYSD